jgi:hypothetical protein
MRFARHTSCNGETVMRSIPDQAEQILLSVLLQDAQLRAVGVPAPLRFTAMRPGLEAQLVRFQDELLDAQRDAGTALAAALNMAGK